MDRLETFLLGLFHDMIENLHSSMDRLETVYKMTITTKLE